MPLFFLLSGYLYRTKGTWFEYVVRKIKHLWLPYVTSTAIVYLVTALVGKTCFTSIGSLVKSVVKVTLMIKTSPLLGAIWFLQVLFYALVLYDLIVRLCKKSMPERADIGVCIIACIFLLIGIVTKMPYRISVIMNSIAFLHIGNEVQNRQILEKIKLPLSIGMIAACFGFSFINRTSYVGNTYTNPVLFLVSAFCGSIGTAALCRSIYRKGAIFEVMQYFGRNSVGPMIWQFVSFKSVIAIQILVYNMSWNQIESFPVIYDYAYGRWVFLDVAIGLFASILLYNVLNRPIQKVTNRLFLTK